MDTPTPPPMPPTFNLRSITIRIDPGTCSELRIVLEPAQPYPVPRPAVATEPAARKRAAKPKR